MVKTYRRFWQVTWAEQWQYRANLLMYLLYWLIAPIIYMAVWTTVAGTNGNVQGFTVNDFKMYYMIGLVVNIVCSTTTIWILAPKIEDGTLAAWLLQPVHPVLTYTLVNNLAFKSLQLLATIPIWALLYWIYQPVLQVQLANVLFALITVVLGFLILFLHGCIMTFLAFWTTRVWAIANVYMAVYALASGEFVPLDLLPSAMQSIARILPYQLTLYFPTQLVLGKISIAAAFGQMGLQLAWVIGLGLIFRWMWKAGVKRFSAVGA